MTNLSGQTTTSRRSLLKGLVAGGGLAAVAVAAPSQAFANAVNRSAASSARPGATGYALIQRGRLRLGQSHAGMTVAAAESQSGRIGVHRAFYTWSQYINGGDAGQIADDHAHGRIPWVSFKPPVGGKPGWDAIAAGAHDAAITKQARRYAALGKPIIQTFNHESSNDDFTAGAGRSYAAATSRIYRLYKAAGATSKVVYVPLQGYWLFNPRNTRDNPHDWMTQELADVIQEVGVYSIDSYHEGDDQNLDYRIPRVRAFLAKYGVTVPVMVGEYGTCNNFSNPSPADYINTGITWAKNHVNQCAVVCYYNCSLNSKPDVYWPLRESTAKTNAWKQQVTSLATG